MLSSLILWITNEPFLNWTVTCDEKQILYDNQWWPVQCLEWEEAQSTFQSQASTKKKVMGTVWWSAFWILVKPLHLRSTLSKLMRCTEHCNACSKNWSTEGLNCSPQQRPNVCHTISASKVEQTGLQSFASSTIFIWLLTNWLPLPVSISAIFCRENTSKIRRKQKVLSKSSQNPNAPILTLPNKRTSCWLKCVDCNGFYVD